MSGSAVEGAGTRAGGGERRRLRLRLRRRGSARRRRLTSRGGSGEAVLAVIARPTMPTIPMMPAASAWRSVLVLILLSTLSSPCPTRCGGGGFGPPLLSPVGAIEATFTPTEGNSPEDAGGPLPLSRAQRDQLTQLDQTIGQSADPQSTLAKIAEGNGMTSEELGDLLMRNRRDMEMAGGGGAGGGGSMMVANVPKQMATALVGLAGAVSKMARRDPRRFALVVAGLFLVMHVIISAPRTGIVTSRGPKPLFLSHGFTTFLPPPRSFVMSHLTSEKFGKRSKMASFGGSGGGGGGSGRKRKALPTIGFSGRMSDVVGDFDDDGITVEKVGRRSERNRDLAYSVTARRRIPLESLSAAGGSVGGDPPGGVGDDGGDADDDDLAKPSPRRPRSDAAADAADLAFDSALSVLSSRRFAEFVGSDDGGGGRGGGGLWFHSSGPPPASGRRSHGGSRRGYGDGGEEEEGAALVMKSLGDLGRYGLQPLRVAYEEGMTSTAAGAGAGAEEEASVAFYTVRGGHFDGEVRFSVERTKRSRAVGDDLEGEDGVVVSVSLLVPRKGRKMRPRLAEKLVSTLASSIAKSTLNEAKTTIARQSQSGRYLGRTRDLAVERRSVRVENERRREEMAQDRRRRWQRNNPDAGRYRPSGQRMISPNNC